MMLGYNKSIVSELCTNTQFLVTSSSTFDMEWEELDEIVQDMKNLKIPIKLIKGVQEWGQDLIKYIFDIKKGEKCVKQLDIVIRDSSLFIINSIKKELNDCDIFIETANQETNIYNLQKGGNHCVLPNSIMYNSFKKNVVRLDPYPESEFAKYSNCLCLKIYDPYFKLENYYGEKVFHLDEIFTIIPTGFEKDDYIILFYKPFCKTDFEVNKRLLEVFNYNLQILEKAFGEEKIFTFDTEFVKGDVFKTTNIVNPPLFNRLLIRKDDMYYIYFPSQNYENKKLLDELMVNINTFFPNIKYKYINTSTLHNLGGNIHCAFKAV